MIFIALKINIAHLLFEELVIVNHKKSTL